MKLNRALLINAIFYNIINLLGMYHISTLPNAKSMIYVFIFPVFWLLSAIILITLAFRNKKIWFSKPYKWSSIVCLLLCTPVPFLLIQIAAAPSSYRALTGFSNKSGHTIKSEEWVYSTGELQVIKYWKAEQPDCELCSEQSFEPDSVWVYFGKKKDTIKVERYKGGKLVSKK